MREFLSNELVLLKERSFSEVFDDFGLFVRTHGKRLLQAFVYVPGPFILAAGILNGYSQLGGPTPGSFGPGTLILLTLAFLSAIAAFIFSLSTVIHFMKGVEKKEELSTSTLRSRVMNSFGPMFIGALGWIGILVVFFFIYFFVSFLVMGVAGLMGPIALGGMGLVFLLFYLFVLPLVAFLTSTTFFQMLREERSFASSLGRAFRLLGRDFWRTWGVMLIGGVLFVVLTGICFIPQFAVAWGYGLLTPTGGFEREGVLLFQTMAMIGYITSTFVAAFFHVLVGLHYYSLHESESGEGLEDRIQSDFSSDRK